MFFTPTISDFLVRLFLWATTLFDIDILPRIMKHNTPHPYTVSRVLMTRLRRSRRFRSFCLLQIPELLL